MHGLSDIGNIERWIQSHFSHHRSFHSVFTSHPYLGPGSKITAEVQYGVPLKIHSDQGACFDGRIIHELCNFTGMTKSRTTAYHPAGNGMCERFNRILLNMLGTLGPAQKRDWKTYVGPMVHAYNATRHTSTNQSPFYLIFGRQARLPIALLFDIESDTKTSYETYMNKLRDRLKNAYELETTSANKSREKQKENYDVRTRAAIIQVGSRVLVKILEFDGKHKLANKWEEIAYTVINQFNPEIPVYMVQREDGTGHTRKLHRNHLLPISFLPVEIPPSPVPIPAPRSRNNKPPKTDKLLINCTKYEMQTDTDDTDDNDGDIVVVTTENVTSGCNNSCNSEKGREELSLYLVQPYGTPCLCQYVMPKQS